MSWDSLAWIVRFVWNRDAARFSGESWEIVNFIAGSLPEIEPQRKRTPDFSFIFCEFLSILLEIDG